jgi:hypothetical protein
MRERSGGTTDGPYPRVPTAPRAQPRTAFGRSAAWKPRGPLQPRWAPGRERTAQQTIDASTPRRGVLRRSIPRRWLAEIYGGRRSSPNPRGPHYACRILVMRRHRGLPRTRAPGALDMPRHVGRPCRSHAKGAGPHVCRRSAPLHGKGKRAFATGPILGKAPVESAQRLRRSEIIAAVGTSRVTARAWSTKFGDLLVVIMYVGPLIIVLLLGVGHGRGTASFYSASAPTAGALLVAVVLAMRDLVDWASSFASGRARLVASAQFLPAVPALAIACALSLVALQHCGPAIHDVQRCGSGADVTWSAVGLALGAGVVLAQIVLAVHRCWTHS